jgi:hypothetical protein
MPFPQSVVEDLLVKCHRRCCLCHRWCGVKMEIDHIEQEADGGANTADNGLPVCFECHAEAHGYNDRHPRGRKFHPSELKRHRDQWFEICATRPEMFIQSTPYANAGPLEALIEELAFNAVIAQSDQHPDISCAFHDSQFRRAIEVGALSTLREDLKILIHETYSSIGRANSFIATKMAGIARSTMGSTAGEQARNMFIGLRPKIEKTHKALLEFLH